MTDNPWVIIPLSFVVALFLTLLPLPTWFENARPEWIMLVLLFWVIKNPYNINMGVAWAFGLILDALNDTLLGEHALAMVVVVFIATKLYRRVRLYSVWRQTISIFFLLLLYHVILFWIQGMIGRPVAQSWFWMSALSSAILWPWVSMLLKGSPNQFKTANNID